MNTRLPLPGRVARLASAFGFRRVGTGGNCSALYRELESGAEQYIIQTKERRSITPTGFARAFAIANPGT